MSEMLSNLIVWIIIGALAGSLVGLALKRSKKGFGWLANVGIGMAGALIGGFLFDILKIDLGLANISVSLQDIVSAFVGSLIFLAIIFFVKRQNLKKAAGPKSRGRLPEGLSDRAPRPRRVAGRDLAMSLLRLAAGS